jgi:hypothetical protein
MACAVFMIVLALLMVALVFVTLIMRGVEGSQRQAKEEEWHKQAREKPLRPQPSPPAEQTRPEKEVCSEGIQAGRSSPPPRESVPRRQDRTQCPGCGTAMKPIKLVYAAPRGGHGELTYTEADAQAGSWSGQFPLKGFVRASVCESCGQIVFYALPITQWA